MKYFTGLLIVLTIMACRERPAKVEVGSDVPISQQGATQTKYPSKLMKVFDAHGGLEKWRTMKSLVYDIPKDGFAERHTINLYSRKDRVDTPDYSMGYDGRDVWLVDSDSKYGGDPVFYHNLMFYFYAMPFVLADDGIIYRDTEDLVFDGKSYPGIGISYESNIGTSPKDEYFIHFDPDTSQMAWLGYTVTYRTGEKSDNVKWIRYDQWLDAEGIRLPKSITWYSYEGKTIQDAKNTVLFENVNLSSEAKDSQFFDKPEDAKVVLPKKQS